MDKELRPCPFCGGRGAMGNTRDTSYIYCTSCMSEGPRAMNYDIEDQLQEAKNLWNKRAN